MTITLVNKWDSKTAFYSFRDEELASFKNEVREGYFYHLKCNFIHMQSARKHSVCDMKSEMLAVVFELFIRWKILPLKTFQCVLFISLRSNNTKAFLLSFNLESVNILYKIKLFSYHKFSSKSLFIVQNTHIPYRISFVHIYSIQSSIWPNKVLIMNFLLKLHPNYYLNINSKC